MSLTGFFVFVACLAIWWLFLLFVRSKAKNFDETKDPDRAVLRNVAEQYTGYARFDEDEQYLKIVLRGLASVQSGETIEVYINDLSCAELVWQGQKLKEKIEYVRLKNRPDFYQGAAVKIRHGENLLAKGVFGGGEPAANFENLV